MKNGQTARREGHRSVNLHLYRIQVVWDDPAAGNEEIAYSGFLPTLQGNYSYQAFSSNVGFAGTRDRFPVLPVRGFGPGTQDFHVAELQLRWVVLQFGRQVARHDQSILRAEIARLQADRARQSVEFDVSQGPKGLQAANVRPA